MQTLVAAIVAIAGTFLFVLMLLVFFSSVVVGVWLAILGEWWAIGYGLGGLSLRFFLPIIFWPYLFIVPLAASLVENGRVLHAFPLFVVAQLYAYAVITGCCLLIFYIFMSRTNPDTFWPLLVWSYFVALGPWVHFTQKDVQGGAATMTLGFAHCAYIVISLLLILGRESFTELSIIFGGIMLLGLLLQAGQTFVSMKSQNQIGVM